MVKVKSINWLSEEAKEAEVCLSDGSYDIVSFAHPFIQTVGDEVLLPIYALNADKIYRLGDIDTSSVERNGIGLEYKLSGYVINKDCKQVRIGGFLIELDIPLPNDIEVGNFVSFTCERLDIS